jgi:phytoene/squalene synthetase
VSKAIATLAQSITWTGSKQTYYIARLMVDRPLMNDFYQAYAYFRWADDVIDVSAQSDDERISFVKRQRALIEELYRNEPQKGLTTEEQILADLIRRDCGENRGLESFIRNMFAIIEFDAYRKGKLISRQDLEWYTQTLGQAVVDGLQYFIGNGHPYPAADNRILAAVAAHITHLLRDALSDMAEGFINIPREYVQAHGISLEDVSSSAFRAWVRERVDQARRFFREGKRYLDTMDVLRCKIVGYRYCARFEGVLNAIERDDYVLRAEYNERHKFSTWLRLAWLGLSLTFQHITR